MPETILLVVWLDLCCCLYGKLIPGDSDSGPGSWIPHTLMNIPPYTRREVHSEWTPMHVTLSSVQSWRASGKRKNGNEGRVWVGENHSDTNVVAGQLYWMQNVITLELTIYKNAC